MWWVMLFMNFLRETSSLYKIKSIKKTKKKDKKLEQINLFLQERNFLGGYSNPNNP